MAAANNRFKFGIFMAPFHEPNENPTVALERDMQLIEWLDQLDFDEAWIGEHHSAGWEIVSSPKIFIAAAAQRTRNIRFGTGVTSLPYHHPLMVANRIVQLDHMTRGRVMLGVGPGALVTDALAMGIDPTLQRPRMAEALDVIMKLFRSEEPVTAKTDWFEIKDAVLHLRPYQRPHPLVAVACTQSPAGPTLAGKYGLAMLSVSVPRDAKGEVNPAYLWRIATETAEEHGYTMDRNEWRLSIPVYLADSRKEAIEDVREKAGRWQREYFEKTLGRPPVPGPMHEIVERQVESGNWIVGDPDDCIAAIERLQEASGGFGGLLVLAHNWTTREKILRSYELLARYVMPHFQGSTVNQQRSNQWARERSEELHKIKTLSLEKAKDQFAKRS